MSHSRRDFDEEYTILHALFLDVGIRGRLMSMIVATRIPLSRRAKEKNMRLKAH
jgi:hypothetical protein